MRIYNTHNRNRKFTNIMSLLVVILVFSLTLCMITWGGTSRLNNFAEAITPAQKEAAAEPIASTSASSSITYANANSFGQFLDGYVYLFTDKSKISGFRSGSLDSDLTKIEVDTSQTHGSQKNPYVIADTNDWEKLVKLCTARANTTGKYFVLANDIDFSGVTFHPVLIFGGEFYGGGHTFSNITCSQWQYWTGSAYANITTQSRACFGVFCNVGGAVADLNIVDYSFTGYPDVLNSSLASWGPFVGVVCGLSADANTYFLNCHTQGRIDDGSISYKASARTGRSGIVGASLINTTSYRCSANITVKSSSTNSNGTPCVDGINGWVFGGTTAYVYNCVATVDADITAPIDYIHAGVASSWIFNGKIVAEDVIGTIKVKSVTIRNASGALLGASNGDATAKNCFVLGTMDANGTLRNMHTYASNAAINTTILSNINYVKEQSLFAAPGATQKGVYDGTAYSTNDALVASAKEFYKNNRIVDASKIDNFGNFNIENNPVRNMDVLYSRGKVVLANPQNVPTTYNGDVQTVKSVVDAAPTSYPWYVPEWYEHTGNYINLTYQDSQGAEVTNVKNAGEYWVKAEITQAWIDAVNAAVDAEATQNGWNDTQKAEVKAMRCPSFSGDPVTESGHTESDTVRWFKFTVSPKELTVNKPSFNASTGDYTAPSFASGSSPYGSDTVTLATLYTGTAADGTPFNQIDVVPNKRGTYTAQAILVNSATDKTEYTGGNYTIANASSMNCQVQINRQRLDIPHASEGSKQYTGDKIKFVLAGYTEEWRKTATLIIPDNSGITLEGDDINGWYLVVAKDAGTYTVNAAIKSENKSDWCWNTGKPSEESTEDKAITVTVTRKTLFVDFLSTSGGFLMQKGADVKFSAEPSNGIEGDTIKITLEYYKSDNASVGIPVPSGTLDASTLDSGTYRLMAKLEDAVAADNKNYELDATGAYQDFTISAQSISIESVGWQYTQNNGLAQPISGGASKDAPAIVVYNGTTFVFGLSDNVAGLASKGVKVDTTFGVNGYENGLQLNATLDPVAITVRLIPYNAEYAFNDENGKPLKEQHKDFTVYVKVNPAEIDFSQLKWSADELEYTAMAQQVVVESGLPSFLRVGYAGNSAWDIGEYEAKIVSLMIIDFEAAANYHVPSVLDSIPTHSWKIVKRRIPIKWVITEETGQDDEIIFVPSLSDDADGAIEYIYCPSMEDTPSVPDTSKEMTLEQICKEYDQTTYKTYYVYARLKAPSETEVRSFSSKNCVLLDGGVEKTESYQGFSVGGNKNPVRVSLKKDTVVYNGKEQPAEVEVDAGGLKVDYRLSYMVKNEAGEYEKFSGIPNDAGEYQVVVEISKAQSGDFAVAGGRYIDYIVEKASFDLSSFKWVDSLNEDAEYTGPYIYNPNTPHKLEYKGAGIEGIIVTCAPADGTSGEYTAAGEYTVNVTFAFADTFIDKMNYKTPDNFEFTWEIEKCAPDLSGVVWNCNDEPFVFSIVDGEPVKYSARLKFPAGLEHLGDLIIYEGDDGKYSDAGFHTTSFRLTTDEELLKNYGDIVFSALLDREIDWEIAPLRVPKAEQIQDKVVYRAGGYSLSEITNLPEDFSQYFEVKVFDITNTEVPATDGTWQFVNIGRYRIQILFKRGMNKSNGGTVDNVKWADNSRGPYQIVLTVNKLVFTIDGWTDGEGIDKPTLNTDDLDELEKYFEYILKKVDTGEIIPIDDVLEMATVYSIALKLKDGHAGNVALIYKDTETELEETEPYVFQTEDPFDIDPTDFLEKPENAELRYEYTGEEITFDLTELEWYNPIEMEVKTGVLKGTEIGEYEVTVGFVSGSLYAWGSAEDWNRLPVTVKIVIYEDEQKGRFILTEAAAASHGYKFLYENFHAYENDISEYVYSAESVVYIANLAYADTLADLLRQFANAEDITAYTADNTLIEDLTTMLATGMMLRIMDGETVLNQLTISVMGDIDGDGDIGTADKARLNSYTLDNLPLTGAYLLACDLDGDGEVGTADKARLNAYTLDTLDIYAGLTLRPAAQTSAQTSSVETLAQTSFVDGNKTETIFAERDTVQTAEPAFADESAFSACKYDVSETANVTFVGTSFAAFVYAEYEITNAEHFVECEIANEMAIQGNETTYTANVDVKSNIAYITIADIKDITLAMNIYVNCKQRV